MGKERAGGAADQLHGGVAGGQRLGGGCGHTAQVHYQVRYKVDQGA